MQRRRSGRRGEWLTAVTVFVCLVLMISFGAWSAGRSHIGLSQRMLVICVRFNNQATTRLTSASDWVTRLTSEVNTFYSQATYGMTTFTFETATGGSVPNNGWFDLGYANTAFDFQKSCQDAINLIDPYVNFSNYDRVLVITNWPDFGGQGGGPWWWEVDEGVEQNFKVGSKTVGMRQMTMAVVNEWVHHSHGITTFDVAASVMAHEIGHQLGLRTHYHSFRWEGTANRDSITPWGIMGLSPGMNHFIGWAKAERQWIPDWRTGGARIRMVGPPVATNIDTTITLVPLETNTGGVQLIGIPLTTMAATSPQFLGYVVENRRRINGDQLLPSDGVLLTLVDESPTIGPGRRCIVLDDPGNPGSLTQAALEVGDVYIDSTHDLTITVVSQTGNNYNVRIQYRLPPVKKADPMITAWTAPPWESVDIWIDSSKNGWGVYKYTDASGDPVGNGDDAWVGHDNRVYVRVNNLGQGTASNVRVKLYSNEPPGMGAAGSKWAYRGTVYLSSIAPLGSTTGYFVWKPTVGKHTCLRAEIQDLPGEISTTNNTAQENVSHFETSSSSPYEPVDLTMQVRNPFPDEELPVLYYVDNIPEGWVVEVDPPQAVLPPDGEDWVSVTIYPSGTSRSPIPDWLADIYTPGYVGKVRIEAQAPYEDTFLPIGGVDLWTHLVLRTQLSLVCDPGGDEVYVGGALIPGVSGATVAIEFTSGGTSEVRYATTDAYGNYGDTFSIPFAGSWRAQAFYAGDGFYRSSESNTCGFVTEGGPSVFAPETQACWICPSLYDGLVKLGPRGEIEPALASTWEIADDGRGYFFYLREAQFHDGTTVTSEEVLRNLVEPVLLCDDRERPPLFEIAPIAGIEVIDEYTLYIELLNPNEELLFLLAGEAGWMVARGGWDDPCSGTGPFRLVERTGSEYAYLEPFESHWDEHRMPGPVEFIVGSSEELLDALASGELDIVVVLSDGFDAQAWAERGYVACDSRDGYFIIARAILSDGLCRSDGDLAFDSILRWEILRVGVPWL
ncbi:ABC transporter substrate-binding protein [Candidatus Bipolaricaulota bacterium]